MFPENLRGALEQTLQELKETGLYKQEFEIASPQGVEITLKDGRKVLNFCANNYLGLAAHPEIIRASTEMMQKRGYGMASVRFICGTQDIHRQLERKIAEFLQKDDSILFAACFDANGGVFEPFFGPEDAIISDELNHASIIDGIRLTKARRFIYRHADMNDLEEKLREARSCRYRIIATDGVFSMDGDMAPLKEICELAERYEALVMVDDSHATGFIGPTGRGTPEHFGVQDRVDIITSTLGKALGGAMGGFIASHQLIIDMYRQKARPYLFSNSLAPMIVGGALKVFELLMKSTHLRDKLMENTRYFRTEMERAGFELKPGNTPIIPIMIYDAVKTARFARRMLEEGIYVVGFSYPVVPRGQARIRVQISAAHEKHHLDRALEAFVKVGKELGVI